LIHDPDMEQSPSRVGAVLIDIIATLNP
jgi:hypothetical protein